MNKSPEEKFNEALKDPIWASWFENQTKKDLWLLMTEKTDQVQEFHEKKHENDRLDNWYSNLLTENQTNARLVFWFVMGVISALIITNL